MLSKAILAFLGKAYLYLRFRNKEMVNSQLRSKYEGQFRNAGTMLLADIFMALAVVVFVALIAAILYFIF
jgi:hypothetical protein